jgi:hypothetical protein
MLRFIAFGLIAVIGIGACESAPSGTSPTSDRVDAPTASSALKHENSRPDRCPFPTETPGYLPWLDEREQVPPGKKDAVDGEVRLVWVPDLSRHVWAGSYVLLRRLAADRIGAGERANVSYDGIPGAFAESESSASVADVGIAWQSKGTGCNTTILNFFSPQLGRAEGKEEVKRIARSLSE